MGRVVRGALGSAIAERDSDTDAHNCRVTIYSVRLAEAQGVGNAVIRRLVKGAFLHDVGKIGVRDDVLLKPGRLDEQGFEIMKTPVTHGLDVIARSAWLRDAGEVIGGHHEKFAGQGHHRGLQGRAIPLTARIFAIADVFDALSSERPHKQPMPVAECIATLQQGAGPHFDPELVARFAAMAVALDARFANDYEAARKEPAGIVERYFRADPAVLSDVIDQGDRGVEPTARPPTVCLSAACRPPRRFRGSTTSGGFAQFWCGNTRLVGMGHSQFHSQRECVSRSRGPILRQWSCGSNPIFGQFTNNRRHETWHGR
jgi:hypothetical protein